MTVSMEHMDKIVKMLIDTYSNPFSTSVQEAVSNAFDANRKAGKEREAILVKYDETLKTLTIKDFGVGIDKEAMSKINQLGYSDKNNDENAIGAFGLGFKAPLSFVRDFNVMSVKNGMYYHFNLSREPFETHLLGEYPTTESNYTEVVLDVSDFRKHEVIKVLNDRLFYFDTVVTDIAEFRNSDQKVFMKTKDLIAVFEKTEGNEDRDSYGRFIPSNKFLPLATSNQLHICLGRVKYPLDLSKIFTDYSGTVSLQEISQILKIGLFFNMDEPLSLVQNRETIIYDPYNIDKIKKKIGNVIHFLLRKKGEQQISFSNFSSALSFYENQSCFLIDKNYPYSFSISEDEQSKLIVFLNYIFPEQPISKYTYYRGKSVFGFDRFEIPISNWIRTIDYFFDYNRSVIEKLATKNKFVDYYQREEDSVKSNRVLDFNSHYRNILTEESSYHFSQCDLPNGSHLIYLRSFEEFRNIQQMEKKDFMSFMWNRIFKRPLSMIGKKAFTNTSYLSFSSFESSYSFTSDFASLPDIVRDKIRNLRVISAYDRSFNYSLGEGVSTIEKVVNPKKFISHLKEVFGFNNIVSYHKQDRRDIIDSSEEFENVKAYNRLLKQITQEYFDLLYFLYVEAYLPGIKYFSESFTKQLDIKKPSNFPKFEGSKRKGVRLPKTHIQFLETPTFSTFLNSSLKGYHTGSFEKYAQILDAQDFLEKFNSKKSKLFIYTEEDIELLILESVGFNIFRSTLPYKKIGNRKVFGSDKEYFRKNHLNSFFVKTKTKELFFDEKGNSKFENVASRREKIKRLNWIFRRALFYLQIEKNQVFKRNNSYGKSSSHYNLNFNQNPASLFYLIPSEIVSRNTRIYTYPKSKFMFLEGSFASATKDVNFFPSSTNRVTKNSINQCYGSYYHFRDALFNTYEKEYRYNRKDCFASYFSGLNIYDAILYRFEQFQKNYEIPEYYKSIICQPSGEDCYKVMRLIKILKSNE